MTGALRGFEGRRVFVTGGSSGIGKAAALLLAAGGARVAIAARNESRLAAAVDEIRSLHGAESISGFALDVADAAQVGRVAPRVLETLCGLDLLINNAGISRPGRFEAQTPELFDAMMRVNFHGTVNVTRAFFDHFRRQGSGHVCNVSSMLGFMGVYGYTAYTASKFAVTGFTDCLRQELLPFGVGVSIVFPPDTDTAMLVEDRKYLPPETREITDSAGLLTAETVARSMLNGIARGRMAILPGWGAAFSWFMYRHFPWLVRRVIDHQLRRGLRKASAPAPT